MQLLLPGIPPIILKKHMLMPVMKKTLLTFEELQSYTRPNLVEILMIKCYQCFKEENNFAA